MFNSLTISAQIHATDEALDSLVTGYYRLSDSDTNKLNICSSIASRHYVADSALLWSNRLVELACKKNNKYFESKGYYYKSLAYYQLGDYLRSSDCNFKSLMIAEEIGCRYHVAYNNAQLGDNNLRLCQYEPAEMFYMDGLQSFQTLHDTVNIAKCYRGIAESYGHQRLYSDAHRYFDKALHLDSAVGCIEGLQLDYLVRGQMTIDRFFSELTKHDMSIISEAKSDLLKASQLPAGSFTARFKALYYLCKSMHCEHLTLHYSGERLQQFSDSLQMYLDELELLSQKLVLKQYRVSVYLGYMNMYSLTGRLEQCKPYLDSVNIYISQDKVKDRDQIMDFYLCSDIYYRMVGDFKNAYNYKSKYYELQNSILVLDYAVKATQSMEQNKYENLLTIQEQEQHIINMRYMYFSLFFVALLLFILFEFFRKRKHNKILSEKNAELDAQASTLNDQNKVITASLNYASIIQRAVMPRTDKLVDMFGQYFVIFRPLHIVAGDFYWANTVGRFEVVVCADCTGHGVPGAFVSMLGISLLNEITSAINDGCESAGYILDTLRIKLMRSLGQNEQSYEPGKDQNKDGIDMALLMVDYENMVLHYAGAMRPLWIMRDGSLLKYKANRMPIGMYFGEVTNFTDNVIDIADGDILYMFSDGITDQFGYVDDEHKVTKQFSAKRLSELIQNIHKLPMSQQKQLIEDALDKWENGHRQIDDITVMGIKIH